MTPVLVTAGERLSIESALPWVMDVLAECAGGELRTAHETDASIHVRVEADRRAFPTGGWELLTRHAWRRSGELVMENACTAGFDLHLRCAPDGAHFTFRWRPPMRDRAAARLLRSRFHLLARALMVQYPALWWAGTRGRAPLHASACTTPSATPLLAAAGGVGRSTVILRELDAGGVATGDNIAVGDGTAVWGLVEPLRVEGGGGRRMPHGRQELPMRGRAATLVPDRVVVLERGTGDQAVLAPCDPRAAHRALVTSTYMAGELRRYWSFAPALTAATGIGPAHPPISDVAAAFAACLPCQSLALGRRPGARLSVLLDRLEITA